MADAVSKAKNDALKGIDPVYDKQKMFKKEENIVKNSKITRASDLID